MTGHCVQTPISWLDIERFALGEVAGDERRAIEEHLEACEACRACVASVEDAPPMALPALPEIPETPWWRRPLVWPAFGAAVVAAAVILIVILRGSPGGGGEVAGVYPPQRVGVKGGEIAIELLREAGEPHVYVSGDRFKVLVTCPPGYASSVDVVVFQDGEAFMLGTQDLSCGNRVAVEGAFRITGDTPVYVCAALDYELNVDELKSRAGAALGDKAVCALVSPATP